MKIGIIIFLVLPIYLYTITLQQKEKNIEKSIVFDLKDKEILEQLFYVFKDDKNTPVSDLIVKVGTYFKEIPYKAATLEINPDDEKLVINLREMDCTTFTENVLAITRTIKAATQPSKNLLQNCKISATVMGKLMVIIQGTIISATGFLKTTEWELSNRFHKKLLEHLTGKR
ncbi:MAG: DUF1460 domain-containing protein [Draconibacterium sp.]|nr:DUF1460 domain-containing protein [Draconibacterium sp.]